MVDEDKKESFAVDSRRSGLDWRRNQVHRYIAVICVEVMVELAGRV